MLVAEPFSFSSLPLVTIWTSSGRSLRSAPRAIAWSDESPVMPSANSSMVAQVVRHPLPLAMVQALPSDNREPSGATLTRLVRGPPVLAMRTSSITASSPAALAAGAIPSPGDSRARWRTLAARPRSASCWPSRGMTSCASPRIARRSVLRVHLVDQAAFRGRPRRGGSCCRTRLKIHSRTLSMG